MGGSKVLPDGKNQTLIRRLRTVLPLRESPVFRSAYLTKTVHRTVPLKTLDLQASPSMRPPSPAAPPALGKALGVRAATA